MSAMAVSNQDVLDQVLDLISGIQEAIIGLSETMVSSCSTKEITNIQLKMSILTGLLDGLNGVVCDTEETITTTLPYEFIDGDWYSVYLNENGDKIKQKVPFAIYYNTNSYGQTDEIGSV